MSTLSFTLGYTGCHGGVGMSVSVSVNDPLVMPMKLSGTIWQRTVTDSATQKAVSYDIDLHGQAQNYAEFDIEIYTENPAADVIFTNTQIELATSQLSFGKPTTRGSSNRARDVSEELLEPSLCGFRGSAPDCVDVEHAAQRCNRC